MTVIECTLNNYSDTDNYASVFSGYSNEFEFTARGVFRKITPPICPACNIRMSHNGHNSYSKKNLGRVKIGRYKCPSCDGSLEEDRTFWEKMKCGFFEVIDSVYQILRDHHVSYEGISAVMSLIYPQKKDTILNAFTESVEKTIVPPPMDIQIVHYDEQFPKAGRTQKFRLTLLDAMTRRPIADELFDKKDPETIRLFLSKYLDLNKPIFIVTDLAPAYPELFRELFGENLIFQWCLLHLNKLIIMDFPRKTTIEQELLKYRLLNIFYNRDEEITFLECLIEEEQLMGHGGLKQYNSWLKEKKKTFGIHLRDQENKRRRQKRNLEQRTYPDAVQTFGALMAEIESFDKPVQKRLRKIENNWSYFTAFYSVENAPATNNAIENYFSTSMKMDRKKQLRTDRGISNQMKLSAMKRAGMLGKCKKTLLEMFLMFTPFLKPG